MTFVKLTIYNIDGSEIATLVNRQLPAGKHIEQWNGRSNDGKAVPTGIYFYSLITNEQSHTGKMLLIK